MYAAKRFSCGLGADKREPTKQFYIMLFVYNTVVLEKLYNDFNSWILDYDRARIDELFR
jgi:hypothetical protein